MIFGNIRNFSEIKKASCKGGCKSDIIILRNVGKFSVEGIVLVESYIAKYKG